MRFINTSSLDFQEVTDTDLNKLENGYSILSHRWGDDEISYNDVSNENPDMTTRSGYAKFMGSCVLARQLGFDLIWIDSCCINSMDSVERSEAINSMYYWYSKARICITYLEDVCSTSEIAQSVWFDRGWTLQELIAPRVVQFYSRTWTYLGDKDSLSTTLADRTGIPVDVLNNIKPPQHCSIAQRMSWAAQRITTRLEDRAYCLMGLFDVNMPMLYGERERAFVRLQEQIIARSTDESIFAWRLDVLEHSTRDPRNVCCGLLAPSPTCFADCGDLVSRGGSRGFRVDQYGLSISVAARFYRPGTFLAVLNVSNTKAENKYAILLSKLSNCEDAEEYYARVGTVTNESFLMVEPNDEKVMRFRIPLNPDETPAIIFPGFWLRELNISDSPIVGLVVLSRGQTDGDRVMLSDQNVGTAGIVMLHLRDGLDPGGYGWMKLGFDAECKPVCSLTFPPFGQDPIAKDFAKALTTAPGSPERHDSSVFNIDWLLASESEIKSLPSYSFDSRNMPSVENVSTDIDLGYNAPTFHVSISMRKQRDQSPYEKDLQHNSHVWTVDISAKYSSYGNVKYYSIKDCLCWR